MTELPTTPEVRIELWLSSVGFNEVRQAEILPDWSTDRDVRVATSWQASFAGPDAWALTLVVSGVVGSATVAGFFGELGKDLYGWIKGRVAPLLAKRPNNSGVLTIEFEEVRILLRLSSNAEIAADQVAAFSRSLPDIPNQIADQVGPPGGSWNDVTILVEGQSVEIGVKSIDVK